MRGQKTGGRVQGTPNRLTKELRNTLKEVIGSELGTIQETLKSLQPEKRLEIVVKLIPYVLPKVEPISMTKNAAIKMTEKRRIVTIKRADL